jgi:hypothetical protein
MSLLFSGLSLYNKILPVSGVIGDENTDDSDVIGADDEGLKKRLPSTALHMSWLRRWSRVLMINEYCT